MRRHLLIGAIDPRFIAARGDDPGLEVVADDLARNATDEVQRVDVAADPVRQVLRPPRLGICLLYTSDAADE